MYARLPPPIVYKGNGTGSQKNVCSAVIYKEIPIYWCNLYNFGFPLDSQKQKHYNNPYCTSAPLLYCGAARYQYL